MGTMSGGGLDESSSAQSANFAQDTKLEKGSNYNFSNHHHQPLTEITTFVDTER